MIKFVRVHKLNAEGQDVGVGILYVNGGNLSCYPPDNPVLKNLMEEEVTRYPLDMAKPHFVDKTEPEVFMESLHRERQGTGLRVGPVEEKETVI